METPPHACWTMPGSGRAINDAPGGRSAPDDMGTRFQFTAFVNLKRQIVVESRQSETDGAYHTPRRGCGRNAATEEAHQKSSRQPYRRRQSSLGGSAEERTVMTTVASCAVSAICCPKVQQHGSKNLRSMLLVAFAAKLLDQSLAFGGMEDDGCARKGGKL